MSDDFKSGILRLIEDVPPFKEGTKVKLLAVVDGTLKTKNYVYQPIDAEDLSWDGQHPTSVVYVSERYLGTTVEQVPPTLRERLEKFPEGDAAELALSLLDSIYMASDKHEVIKLLKEQGW